MRDLDSLPHSPGCYLFKDSSGTIIYIGKAKDLRKRVSSYFLKKDHDPKTKALVSHIADIELIATKNEVEAFLLENNLIKKNHPKYNIDLKDSRRYAYLMLTDEQFPRLILARKREDKGEYFGPFVSGEAREYIKDLLQRMFKLRTCKKFPKKPCLRFHIGICAAPCSGNIDEAAYKENVKAVSTVLKGGISEVKQALKEDMAKASASQNYEKALEAKNRLDALSWLSEKQSMERQKTHDEDIINYLVKGETLYLMLFNIYKGVLENKQEFEIPISHPAAESAEEFLLQYYSENLIPKEIILPERLSEALPAFLSQLKGERVRLTVPKIGDKKILLDLVSKNIHLSFFESIEAVDELKDALKLQESPQIIECFDISHLSGTSMVASMVQFRNGKPDKSNYRRFKIRTVKDIDDCAAIAEVVGRRYKRLIEEKQNFPNLIIIDGGKGQLSAALSQLKELGVAIPTISLAKRLEEVFVPGAENPLMLDRKGKPLKLLQQIRDEAHRFAIAYNRLLRKKALKDD